MSTVTASYRSLSFLVRLHGDKLVSVLTIAAALVLGGEIGMLLMQDY
jgi:hypothetical protein